MKQYDSYKESGVEWIGKVPTHWEIMPLKFTGTFGNGLTYSPKDVVDNGILVLRSSNIQNSSLSFEDNVYVSNVSKVLLVQKGDVIICSRNGSAALVGKSAFIDKEINATFGAFMMRYIPKINKKYGFYLFQTAIGRYKGYFATTTINQLTKSTIGEMKVPLANTEEQTAIVDFLDNKCSEIDKVISAQQKRIALLQELKQSVITHAVTKGLNPNVEMKDSGVDWIDEIPANWEVLPLKRVGTMNKGLTFTKADIVEKGNAAISYGQVHSKLNEGISLQDELIRFVPNTFVSNAEKSIAYQGDFIFADTSEDYEGCGNCVYNDTTRPIYGGYHTIVLQTKYSDAKFLAYLFKTDYWRYQIRSRVYGVKVFSITQSILSLCSVILPPKEVQKDIVSFLDGKCKAINISIDNALVQISLLQEYKQSLITEVVTGKRKVC